MIINMITIRRIVNHVKVLFENIKITYAIMGSVVEQFPNQNSHSNLDGMTYMVWNILCHKPYAINENSCSIKNLLIFLRDTLSHFMIVWRNWIIFKNFCRLIIF